MEDILKEILYELKEMNRKLDEKNKFEGLNEHIKGPCIIKVSLGEDVLVEKVIDNINKQNRISGKTTIVV